MATSFRSSSTKKSLEDRRLLIRALFQNFEKQGGRIIYPATDNEDTLLDRLHVATLLEALKSGKYVDIGKLGEPGGAIHEGMDPGMGVESGMDLVLNISQLATSLDEHELQELAFMLFCVFCMDEQTQLTTTLRRQLELSASCAEDIIKVSQRIQPQSETASAVPEEIGLDLMLKLIKDVRPSDFRKFRDFVKWRDVMARVLVQLIQESVHPSHHPDSPEDLPQLLANLKGAVRRLCFQEADEYEEKEYSEAILSVTSIARRMAPYSQSGFSFTWGLRMHLWETLLTALFEAYEEDIYIDEMEAVSALLVEHLAPKLQISPALHDACFAWVHFKQLSQSLFPGLCPVLETLMTTVLTNDPALEEMDGIYVSEITRVWFAYFTEALMDYHAKVPESEIMSGMVELYLTLTERRSSGKRRPPSLEECISASCIKAFQRMQERQSVYENPNLHLKALAEETRELYETELLKYTGALAPFCSVAAAVSAKALHECFGQELKPVLYELKAIPEEVVQMLKTADALESILMKEITQEPSVAASVVPWNVMDAISELLFSWVDTQLQKIKEWRERLVQEETWQPKSESNPLSQSAVEFKTLLEESIALVFSLDLNFPENLVDRFITGVAASLESYAEATMSDIRGEEGCRLLIPRAPELTRYKKELAESAVLKEQRSMEAKPNKRHSRLKSILVDSSVSKMVPLIEDSENYQWFNNLKTQNLIVRINSLHYLNESIPELSGMIETNSVSHGVKKDMQQHSSSEPLWAASVKLDRCVQVFCQFLGTKAVFWDGRLPWLEQLYRHNVVNSRLDQILQDLCKILTDINSTALQSIRNRIVQSLLEACVAGLQRVLLEGGPYRLFKIGPAPDDRELIEDDVKKLKDLFNDAEEGLRMSLIEEITKPVFGILMHMSLPTSNLILLAEDTKKNNSPEFKTFTQILGHRADRAASKWLKKTMKVPKKSKTKL